MLKREWEEEQVVNRSLGFASYFKGFGEECPDETVWKFLAQETCSEGSEKKSLSFECWRNRCAE